MPSHIAFFISSALFIAGVFLPSAGFPFWVSILAAAAAFAVLSRRFGFKPIAAISLFVVAGSFYYLYDDYRYHQALSSVPDVSEIRGVVANDPERGFNSQAFYIKTAGHKFLLRTALYPEYFYGDELLVSGAIDAPPTDYYGRYLAKEKVHGTMFYPRIERVSSGSGRERRFLYGAGDEILSSLFRLKGSIKESYQKFLPYEQAAFLSGVTLSSREDLSEEFLEKLSLSGTRHLIAISGLHMAIIIFLIWDALTYFIPKKRKFALVLTFLAVAAFTAMTGFKVSAIRASIMGFIALAAKEAVGRPRAAYNAIALAAVIMILINPKVLVYDIGFQLSFIAAISIVYFMPVLRAAFLSLRPKRVWPPSSGLRARFASIGDGGGFLGWKDAFLVTFSAQIATAPILISQFQNFSLTSFAANVLVLPAVPFIMALGFLTGLSSLIFSPISHLISFALTPLIGYAIFIVNFFAGLSVLFNPRLGVFGAVLYYGILTFVAYRFYDSKNSP